ncbi:MAG: hypothetical protein JW774_07255 [Candidatus Aureabacteria bacterium]|nr:hypothetical protein [Candidatus Auribacterota bacterium]
MFIPIRYRGKLKMEFPYVRLADMDFDIPVASFIKNLPGYFFSRDSHLLFISKMDNALPSSIDF